MRARSVEIMRIIFDPTRNNDDEFKIRRNNELLNLYCETSLVETLKSNRIS